MSATKPVQRPDDDAVPNVAAPEIGWIVFRTTSVPEHRGGLSLYTVTARLVLVPTPLPRVGQGQMST